MHQWVKNLLLFVPIVLAHEVSDPIRLGQVALSALAFSLFASALYIVNDLLDIEADRRHPRKRKRPFAAGRISIAHGLLIAGGLALAAIALGLVLLPPAFTLVLLSYGALALLYSSYLKRKLIVDVLMLAGFYAYRIVAGGAATGIAVSPWLLAFSLFFFLFLLFAKHLPSVSMTEMKETISKGENHVR